MQIQQTRSDKTETKICQKCGKRKEYLSGVCRNCLNEGPAKTPADFNGSFHAMLNFYRGE